MPCLSLNYLWFKKTPVQYTEEEEMCTCMSQSTASKYMYYLSIKNNQQGNQFFEMWIKAIRSLSKQSTISSRKVWHSQLSLLQKNNSLHAKMTKSLDHNMVTTGQNLAISKLLINSWLPQVCFFQNPCWLTQKYGVCLQVVIPFHCFTIVR